jgi:2-polyprenyl-3-methyl-5-hydroxy-6-metoxy-1,4-benzoquinol methylase
MDRDKETFQTWNKLAALYQEKFMDLELYNKSYDFICDSITKEEAAILDIGCGPGNITRYLLSKRPGYRITGVDMAPNMVELARINNPTASFMTLDIRQISRLKPGFDAIVCGFAVPYLSTDETAALITDSYHLLKEKGLLYISFVAGDPEKSGFKTSSSGDRTYFYYHNADILLEQLATHGFRVIRIFTVEYITAAGETEPHTIIVAGKTGPVS